MPAKDLGTKHVCFKCGTRFYDLKKPEPMCPKCGTDQRQNPALKTSASEKRRAAPRPAPAPAPVAAEEEADTPDVEADEDDLDADDEDDAEDDEP